jgi:hypothetical protein
MAARFTKAAEARFDERFKRPAAEVLRAVGSEGTTPKAVYDKLGSLWAEAERELLALRASKASVRRAVVAELGKLWKEIRPTLPGKSKVLLNRLSSIEQTRDSEMTRAVSSPAPPGGRPSLCRHFVTTPMDQD